MDGTLKKVKEKEVAQMIRWDDDIRLSASDVEQIDLRKPVFHVMENIGECLC